MAAETLSCAVFGNVTLDIICRTVDDVPRHDSIAFQEAAVTPGGCASNTAIQLAQLGETVYLIAWTGNDRAADLLESTWKEQGVSAEFVRRAEGLGTGVSVGLVDSDLQPRFIHTPGANSLLNADSLNVESLLEKGVGFLHVAGYFVLPGLLEDGFAGPLSRLRESGIHTSLDVVTSPAMDHPEVLWPLLPHLDALLCNRREAEIITGVGDPGEAAGILHERGARNVIVKLGPEGCWLSEDGRGKLIPGIQVADPCDTTGAGDAFAAGLLAGLRQGLDLVAACGLGNQLGAAATAYLGAVQLV